MKYAEIASAKQNASAQPLSMLANAQVYPASITAISEGIVFMSKDQAGKRVHLLREAGKPLAEQARQLGANAAEVFLEGEKLALSTLAADHTAALALRSFLPWAKPKILGLSTSIGLGDRLGLATPGHLRAVSGSGFMPVLAQQSMRELTRTERKAENVLDCATFGALQSGWRNGFGSDADHLKTIEDIEAYRQAGFTMFTIDPGEHVNNEADSLADNSLASAFDALPWAALESSASDCSSLYEDREIKLDNGQSFLLTAETLRRAAVKYGKAIAHTVKLFRHLTDKAGKGNFELEMSVDETASVTSPAEHYFVASELKRLGVKWSSLAPRFSGRFEKGVDYIGDIALFEKEFALHAAISRLVGPYKMSIHSGSDKFAVYPIIAKHAGRLVHLKTAGTSWLEALRALAKVAPALFREVLAFAKENYENDKKSYHVSATLDKMMDPAKVKDGELEQALEQFDTRQAFHVTFGSVLTRRDTAGKYLFRERIYQALEANEEAHYQCLEKHLGRHIAPFR